MTENITKYRLFDDTFRLIRNYLVLTDKYFCDYNLNECLENQFKNILTDKLDENIQESFNIELVHTHGGYEGAGEEYWFVVKIFDQDLNKDRYFRVPARYNSYDDSEYYLNDTFEVQPIERTCIFYEKI